MSDIVTAKFLMGVFGLLIAAFVISYSLAHQLDDYLEQGLLLASNIVMFFLGRSTTRKPEDRQVE